MSDKQYGVDDAREDVDTALEGNVCSQSEVDAHDRAIAFIERQQTDIEELEAMCGWLAVRTVIADDDTYFCPWAVNHQHQLATCVLTDEECECYDCDADAKVPLVLDLTREAVRKAACE